MAERSSVFSYDDDDDGASSFRSTNTGQALPGMLLSKRKLAKRCISRAAP